MPTIAVDPPAELLTPRLRLRFHRMMDLDRLVDLIGKFEVARYLSRVPYPYSRADGEDFIKATMDGVTGDGELIYAISTKGDDEIIGGTGLIFEGPETELGYWLGEPYWGHGYAREAVAVILDMAFGQLGLSSIYANVQAENTASRRLLAALGFRQKGLAPIFQMIEKREVMGPHYELVRDDWKGERA